MPDPDIPIDPGSLKPAKPLPKICAMPGHSIRARAPHGDARVAPRIERDPDVLASFVEDAAHFPGGFAAGVAVPSSEAEVAALMRSAPAVLPIGAQSSLTGGATPKGELVLSTRSPEPHRLGPEVDTGARLRARRGRRHARRSRRGACAIGPLLSAGSHLHRRLRRRHRRHQRGRGGDVQVRHDARLGEGADGRPGQRRRARRRARPHGGRSRRLFRDRPVRPHRARSVCRATACRTCPSSRPATSPRRAWTSSTCSSDPRARLASSPR